MRQASVERNTLETRIKASVDLDGQGRYAVATGIGRLHHEHVLSLSLSIPHQLHFVILVLRSGTALSPSCYITID